MKTAEQGPGTALDSERKAQLAAELAGDAAPERRRAKPAAPAAEEEEREFTLSTATLFGLFLALVLLCGIFFGFGFTMGRRSNQTAANAQQPATAATESGSSAANSSSEPAPPPLPAASDGAPAPEQDTVNQNTPSQTPADQSGSAQAVPNQAAVGQAATSQAPTQAPAPTISLPVAETPLERRMEGAAQRQTHIKRVSTASSSASVASAPAPALAKPSPTAAGPALAQPSAGAGEIMVQVAAVARDKDANLLATSLRQKGYPAVVRTSPNDKLLHVQVGPFRTRQQADAMRRKLGSSGYNAILK